MNLIPILKKLPKNYKLWSPLCGYCTIEKIHNPKFYALPIFTKTENNLLASFTEEGKYCNDKDTECVLFPSKEERDWKEFNNKVFPPFKIERTVGKKYYYIKDLYIMNGFDLNTVTNIFHYRNHNYFNTIEQAKIALKNIKQCFKSLSNH